MSNTILDISLYYVLYSYYIKFTQEDYMLNEASDKQTFFIIKSLISKTNLNINVFKKLLLKNYTSKRDL